MNEVENMQVKANRVIIRTSDDTDLSLEDVNIIKGSPGLYVEMQKKIGVDNDGNDLNQRQLLLIPWERVVEVNWTEPTLIDQVKEFVILTQLEDFSDILEELEEELSDASDAVDDKGENPYK